MSENDRDAVRKRRGHWMRIARERLGLSTDQVAKAVGYTGQKPGSIVTRWEKGERAVPSDRFELLARVLGLPPEWLTTPPVSDVERLEARLDELARAAGALEREDWEAVQDRAPAADDEPGVEPGRQTA